MPTMTYDEQRTAVARAVNSFPAKFGLRNFPGDQFRINGANSFWSDGVVLYTDRLVDGTWLAFAKGSPDELRANMVRL